MSTAIANTYLDPEHPRICIKGPEIGDGSNTPNNLINIGYDNLPKEDRFLFYELRCAAVVHDTRKPFQNAEMKKRIDSQFWTLKNKGIRHASLGAFGCGAFNNPPKEVAQLYKECLMTYRNDFDVIAFPIYYAGSGDQNFNVFKETLLGVARTAPIDHKFY
jgi:hypothetical protein